jgi:hypothetical protein
MILKEFGPEDIAHTSAYKFGVSRPSTAQKLIFQKLFILSMNSI